MGSRLLVDTRFDVRAEAGGRDPDRFSKTLRVYHQLLWSKPLPGGAVFDLDATLRHTNDVGNFRLSSDTIAATYLRWGGPPRLVDVVRQAPPDEVNAFSGLACTVGAFLVFPLAVRKDGERSALNQPGPRHQLQDPRSFRPHPRVHPTPLPGHRQPPGRRPRPA